MNIDTTHLHHWMQAIRKSEDPLRTMDAFWSGQLKSKEWLISNINEFVDRNASYEIHGGWVGVLASMMFQSELSPSYILSLDIDPTCQPISEEMNRIEFNNHRFESKTADMCEHTPNADVVVNTSCEHISQDQYNNWLSRVRQDQLLVLQSNNFDIVEHVRIAPTIEEFTTQSNLSRVCFAGELELPLYKRFMIIGYK